MAGRACYRAASNAMMRITMFSVKPVKPEDGFCRPANYDMDDLV